MTPNEQLEAERYTGIYVSPEIVWAALEELKPLSPDEMLRAAKFLANEQNHWVEEHGFTLETEEFTQVLPAAKMKEIVGFLQKCLDDGLPKVFVRYEEIPEEKYDSNGDFLENEDKWGLNFYMKKNPDKIATRAAQDLKKDIVGARTRAKNEEKRKEMRQKREERMAALLGQMQNGEIDMAEFIKLSDEAKNEFRI